MPLVRTRVSRAPVVAVAVAILAAAAPSARAQVVPVPTPTLDYGGTQLRGQVTRNGSVVASDTRTLGPGENGLVAPLYLPGDLTKFPTSQSTLTEGYASAVMAASGFGGVGVSFWSPGTPDLRSQAIWQQTVSNTGPHGVLVQADYTIPGLETSILAGPPYGPFPVGQRPEVVSSATLRATRVRADGSLGPEQIVFDYTLGLQRRERGSEIESYDVFRSPDLEADAGNGTVLRIFDVTGIDYGAFSSTRLIGTLGAGESFVFQYRMDVAALAQRTRTPELGYQALVGDPFAVGGAGLLIREAPNATTAPEPASAALLALGLGGLAIVRRRYPSTRSASTGLTRDARRAGTALASRVTPPSSSAAAP